MTRLGIILVILVATGIVFYATSSSNIVVVEKEKNKGPWKFLHCTSNNKDCGKLE